MTTTSTEGPHDPTLVDIARAGKTRIMRALRREPNDIARSARLRTADAFHKLARTDPHAAHALERLQKTAPGTPEHDEALRAYHGALYSIEHVIIASVRDATRERIQASYTPRPRLGAIHLLHAFLNAILVIPLLAAFIVPAETWHARGINHWLLAAWSCIALYALTLTSWWWRENEILARIERARATNTIENP